MPILTHSFDYFPKHMEHDLIDIYAPDCLFDNENKESTLDQIKKKMSSDRARLYATHFGGRWLACAVVTGTTETRQVHHLCVHTSVRLRGIGKKLLNEVRRLESIAGNERLITCISSNDQAAQFFLNATTAYSEPYEAAEASVSSPPPFKKNRTSLCFSIME